MSIPIIKEVPLGQIRPGRFQPRQTFDDIELLELAQSIRDDGLLDIPLVFLNDEGNYELIGGERRWRASCALAVVAGGALNDGDSPGELAEAIALVNQAADKNPAAMIATWQQALDSQTMPVNEQPGDDVQSHHVKSVVHNFQRADLSPVEVANALYQLKEEYRLSLRELAKLVGKSKSYVDDHLRLLDLAPAVAKMMNDGGDGPTLDMTVAREMARKLPNEMMQQVIAADLQKRAAKGQGSAELKKLINQVAAFIDPNRWSLTNDTDIPYHPSYTNRARLIRHLLETLPAKKLAEASLKLAGAADRFNANYLSKKVSAILNNDWETRSVTKALLGEDDPWPQVAAHEGWTCNNCILGPIAGAIENRVELFDGWNSPCEKLDRSGKIKECNTCTRFVGDGIIGPPDAAVITVPGYIIDYLPDADKEGLKTPLQGENASYVQTWQAYCHLYNVARLEREQRDQRESEAGKTAHLPKMQAYWAAQQGDDTQFALADFQAHACRKCANFTGTANSGPEETPCQFAEKPLTRNGAARPPEYGVLVSQAGAVVPRCEKFKARELPPVQRPLNSGFSIPDRSLILEWYKLMTAGASTWNTHYIYSPLNWLNGGRKPNLAKLWDEVDNDDVMMAILQAGVVETANLRGYGNELELCDLTSGKLVKWKTIEWWAYAEKRKPGDWAKPW